MLPWYVLLFTCAGAACTDPTLELLPLDAPLPPNPPAPEGWPWPCNAGGLRVKLRSMTSPVTHNAPELRLIRQSTSAKNLWPEKRQHQLRCRMARQLFKIKPISAEERAASGGVELRREGLIWIQAGIRAVCALIRQLASEQSACR